MDKALDIQEENFHVKTKSTFSLQWLDIEVDFEYFTEQGEIYKMSSFREISCCLGVLKDF